MNSVSFERLVLVSTVPIIKVLFSTPSYTPLPHFRNLRMQWNPIRHAFLLNWQSNSWHEYMFIFIDVVKWQFPSSHAPIKRIY